MNKTEQQHIFDNWLREHKGLLFKVVRAYAPTSDDRDDLFQEISIQLWHSVPKFRGESSEPTWIYRVALFAAIAWTRKEKKHRIPSQSIHSSEPLLLETDAARDSRIDWLYEQIKQLSKIDRSVTLLLLDGFSYKEIASILGISESNVGVKINRIKKHLAEKSQE